LIPARHCAQRAQVEIWLGSRLLETAEMIRLLMSTSMCLCRGACSCLASTRRGWAKSLSPLPPRAGGPCVAQSAWGLRKVGRRSLSMPGALLSPAEPRAWPPAAPRAACRCLVPSLITPSLIVFGRPCPSAKRPDRSSQLLLIRVLVLELELPERAPYLASVKQVLRYCFERSEDQRYTALTRFVSWSSLLV
jgi:hypothetical protein